MSTEPTPHPAREIAEKRASESVSDLKLWIERHLQTLHARQNPSGYPPCDKPSGFAVAEIPDWELRQKLESLSAVSTALTRSEEEKNNERELSEAKLRMRDGMIYDLKDQLSTLTARLKEAESLIHELENLWTLEPQDGSDIWWETLEEIRTKSRSFLSASPPVEKEPEISPDLKAHLESARHWKCECGARCDASEAWRWNGRQWEHHHGGQAGHFAASFRKLSAHHTGDSWYLHELDAENNVIDEEGLPWPKDWPESVSTTFLRENGFEIV